MDGSHSASFENWINFAPIYIYNAVFTFSNPVKGWKITGLIKKQTMNIFVGNLDYKVNEHELEELFEEYGSVSSAKIITDKYDGRSKGFGFITMESQEEAEAAIKGLNGTSLKSRDMVVNEAKPRSDERRTF
jgi:RNA recognition motif-containing protein